MNAPDTSDIDLDPANFRCPADLWYCLDQLYNRIGRPPYSELSKRTGEKLATSTISDLIGKNSKTSTNASRPSLRSVELFVLACGVPETELEGWEAAWKASVAQDKPAWPEERKQLLAKIDQLTADLTEAKTPTDQLTTELAIAKARVNRLTLDFAVAEKRINQCQTDLAATRLRAMKAEAALDVYSSVPDLPEFLEQLYIKAETYYNSGDYVGAADLHRQIVEQIKREHGAGDPLTLHAKRVYLDVATRASAAGWSQKNRCFRVYVYCKLNARWRKLIREHQRYLSKGDRITLELRLDHAYWMALLHPRSYRKDDLPSVRKLLIGLYADCKLFLSPNDPFAAEVFKDMKTDLSFCRSFDPPKHQQALKHRIKTATTTDAQ